MKLLQVIVLLPSLVSTSATAATLTVTTTSDEVLMGDGCSLREAILAANDDIAVMDCVAGSGPDTIVFDIPGPGVHQIVIEDDLPDISSPLHIDGLSQPGSSCSLGQRIEITDPNPGIASSGPYRGLFFSSTASGSSVRGLRIVGIEWQSPIDFFPQGVGIEINGIDGFTVQCSVIGNVNSLLIVGSNVVVGTDLDGMEDNQEGNWVFGREAIYITRSSNISLAGNQIGTPPAGDIAILTPDLGVGVFDSDGVVIGTEDASFRHIAGNVIDSQFGVFTRYNGTHPTLDVVISGNWLGVDKNGNILRNSWIPITVDLRHTVSLDGRIQIGTPLNDDLDGFAGNIISGRGQMGYFDSIMLQNTQDMSLTLEGNVIVSGNYGRADSQDPSNGVLVTRSAPSTVKDNLILGWNLGVRQHTQASSVSDSTGNCFLENDVAASGIAGFDLSGNWWGSPDGPSGEGPGNGDPVGTGVIYDPFLTEPPQSCSLIALAPRSVFQIPMLSSWALVVLGLFVASFSAYQRWLRGRGMS